MPSIPTNRLGIISELPKFAASLAERSAAADKEALRTILQTTLVSSALGAGAAGLAGLRSAVQQPSLRLSAPAITDSPTYVDMRTTPSPKRKPINWIRTSSPLLGRYKQASAGPLTRLVDTAYDNVLRPTWLDKALNFGLQTTTPAAKPGMMGGLVLGAAGGMAGGWHLVNWLNKRRENNNQLADTSSAEREYMDAVKELRGVGKLAILDEAMVKMAQEKSNFSQEIKAAIAAAAGVTDTRPTDAQKAAGNYRKGRFSLWGRQFVIENPRGSVRSGKDKSGKAWSITMPHHYGYILATESEADGDHLDVFIGPDVTSSMVYIVNQKTSSGKFDEHKIMVGWDSATDAKQAYLSAYSPGWQGFGSLVAMSVPDFLRWIKTGDTGHTVTTLQKEALLGVSFGEPAALSNALGIGLNTAGAMAIPAGLLSGALTYNMVRNSGKNRALQAALYHRMRQQQTRRPASVVMVQPEEE